MLPFKLDRAQRSEGQHLVEAARQFDAFLQRFPNGAYTEKAHKRLKKIHGLIVTKEYHIAHFYFEQRDYLAAYNRIVDLLKRYPSALDILGKKHADIIAKDYHATKEKLGFTEQYAADSGKL